MPVPPPSVVPEARDAPPHDSVDALLDLAVVALGAQRLLPLGCGAVFSFNLAGSRAQGRKFIETLSIFSHLANVGDAKSLVIHPASTTHFRMSAEDLVTAGITEGTIRLSVGLEHPEDLIEDLSRALHGAGKA